MLEIAKYPKFCIYSPTQTEVKHDIYYLENSKQPLFLFSL